jgi:serine O-acetyltransferase
MNLKISSLLTSGSGIFRLLVGIVSAPLLVRALGLADYGLWTVANSLILICLLVDFGINTAVITYVAADVARRDRDRTTRTLSTSMLMVTAFGIITAAAVLLSLPWLGKAFFPVAADRARATPALVLLCFGLPLRLWQGWAAAIEGALLRYDWQTAVELPSSLAIQVGLLAAAWFHGGILGLAALQLAIQVFTCFAHAWALRKVLPAPIRVTAFSAHSVRELIGFGGIHWLTSMGATLFNQADRLIVNLVLGPAATGIYTAITTVANKIVEMCVLPLKILPAAVSAAHAVGDDARVRRLFNEAACVSGAVAWCCCAGLLFFAEPLMRLILGHAYIPLASSGLRGVALIYGINSLCLCAGWFGLGLSRPAILARWTIPGTAVMCVTMYLMSQRFGLMGAVWSNVGYLITVGVTVQVTRLIGLSWKAVVAAFGPTVVALVAAYCVTSLPAYNALPFWIQAAAFLVAGPIVLLNIVTISRLRGLAPMVLKHLPGLRNREQKLLNILEILEMQRTNFKSMLHQIWEDRIAHGRQIMLPGFQAIAWHRFGVWAQGLPAFARLFLIPLYELGFIFMRNIYKINVYRSTVLGRRVLFPNQGNITIHRDCIIGDDCAIRQNVSIGGVSRNHNSGPVLEAGVEVGAGAVIMGAIIIGEGAKIGPNAVISCDVPAGAIAIAPATRILGGRPARSRSTSNNGHETAVAGAAWKSNND